MDKEELMTCEGLGQNNLLSYSGIQSKPQKSKKKASV